MEIKTHNPTLDPTLVETFGEMPAEVSVVVPEMPVQLDLFPETVASSDDPALAGHTAEEVSEMLTEVMTNNPEDLGLSARQTFSDTQRAEAEAYNVHNTTIELLYELKEASDTMVNLLVKVHAHLAHEWNKAIVLEDTESQQILQLAESPRWYGKATDSFQEGIMFLNRAIQQRKGF